MSYYPNQCPFCSERQNLIRCTKCNMVSFCKTHQAYAVKNHRPMCKLVAAYLRRKKVTHIYENLKGLERRKWLHETEKIISDIEGKLSQKLDYYIYEVFRFPRVCFVCFEARQNLLKNCPNCPLASFCEEHPSSPIHDRDCFAIQSVYHSDYKTYIPGPVLPEFVLKIIAHTPFKATFEVPNSLDEFIEQHLSQGNDRNIREVFSHPLSVLNALTKLDNIHNLSQIVFHIIGLKFSPTLFICWEILLHFLPNLRSLIVIMLENSYEVKEFAIKLCKGCTMRNKKLAVESVSSTYLLYSEQPHFRKPNLIAMFNAVIPDRNYESVHNIVFLSTLLLAADISPFVVTISERIYQEPIFNILRDRTKIARIVYAGENSLRLPFTQLNWFDWSVMRKHEFMIVTDSRQIAPAAEPERDSRAERKFFFPSICHVCRILNAPVHCKKCKMIFYCSEKHMTDHWNEHKNLCKVILGMLNERGVSNLFDGFKTEDEDLWLMTKIDLLKKAELKLGTEIVEDQREMFLFPKTCSVCHESELSALRHCICGTYFCKMHKDNADHKDICEELIYARRLMLEDRPKISLTMNLLSGKCQFFPFTIKEFLRTYIEVKNNINDREIRDANILLSDFLTEAFTTIYITSHFAKDKFMGQTSLLIHVLGVNPNEIPNLATWKFVLYWFSNFRHFKIVFIGFKEKKIRPSSIMNVSFDLSSALVGQKLSVETSLLRYEEYYKSKNFCKPDIIIGFNLEMHESDLEIEKDVWRETIMTIKKLQIPLILTVGNESRALREDTHIRRILDDNPIDCHICIENPFASLAPQRDFITEKLRYHNKFILVYVIRHQEECDSLEAEIRRILAEKTDDVETKSTDNDDCSDEKKLGEEEKVKEDTEEKSFESLPSTSGLQKETKAVNIDCTKKVFKSRLQEIKETEDSEEDSDSEVDEMKYEYMLLEAENRILKESVSLKEENLKLLELRNKLCAELEKLEVENKSPQDSPESPETSEI